VIFGEKLLPKVLDGSKTVTRRPVKWEDTGFEVRNRPCKYAVGRTYGVQPVIKDGPGKGRGGKSVARIRIKSVRREPLGHQLTIGEAAKEGFGGFRAFRDYWEGELYGSYDPTQLVDRIEFELVEEA
jgi:hypothetical protein